MRLLVVALGLVVAALQYALWFGDDSIPDLLKLNRAINSQQVENERLAARNRTMAAEVVDLKAGDQAIEERARNDLGMVRKGETFYQVIPGS